MLSTDWGIMWIVGTQLFKHSLLSPSVCIGRRLESGARAPSSSSFYFFRVILEKEDLPSTGSLSRWLQWPGLSQPKARNCKSGRGSDTQVGFHYFFWAIRGELD